MYAKFHIAAVVAGRTAQTDTRKEMEFQERLHSQMEFGYTLPWAHG